MVSRYKDEGWGRGSNKDLARINYKSSLLYLAYIFVFSLNNLLKIICIENFVSSNFKTGI